MNETRYERLVIVDRYMYQYQAEAAKLHLEAAGIRATVTGAGTVVMDWMLAAAVGRIRVEVLESDLERAREVLSHMPAASTLGDVFRPRNFEIKEAPRCLACQAKMTETETVCPSCGWTFLEEPESPPKSTDAYWKDAEKESLIQSLRRFGLFMFMIAAGWYLVGYAYTFTVLLFRHLR